MWIKQIKTWVKHVWLLITRVAPCLEGRNCVCLFWRCISRTVWSVGRCTISPVWLIVAVCPQCAITVSKRKARKQRRQLQKTELLKGAWVCIQRGGSCDRCGIRAILPAERYCSFGVMVSVGYSFISFIHYGVKTAHSLPVLIVRFCSNLPLHNFVQFWGISFHNLLSVLNCLAFNPQCISWVFITNLKTIFPKQCSPNVIFDEFWTDFIPVHLTTGIISIKQYIMVCVLRIERYIIIKRNLYRVRYIVRVM